jgi:Fe-S-cluster containining protein
MDSDDKSEIRSDSETGKEAATNRSLNSSDAFECTMCGECCNGYGGTYVTEDDIRAIAAYIDTDPASFRNDYCSFSDGKPLLKSGEDGKCIFFKEKCSIHPVKPRMCREWPFIPAVLKEPGNWNLMSDACPGIKTDIDREALKRITEAELKKNRG